MSLAPRARRSRSLVVLVAVLATLAGCDHAFAPRVDAGSPHRDAITSLPPSRDAAGDSAPDSAPDAAPDASSADAPELAVEYRASCSLDECVRRLARLHAARTAHYGAEPVMTDRMAALVPDVQHAIRDVVVAAVEAAPRFTPAAVHATISRALARGGALDQTRFDPETDTSPDVFGLIEEVSLTQPPGHPEYLLANVMWQVPCPYHRELFVFRRDVDARARPRLLLAAQPAMRTEADGTNFGDVHAIGFDQPGGPYFVRTYLPTVCMGAWHGEVIEVLAAGADPLRPRVLYHQAFPSTQAVELRTDEQPRVITGPQGFRVIRADVQWAANSRLVCLVTTNFQFTGDGVAQVGPVRSRPRACESFAF